MPRTRLLASRWWIVFGSVLGLMVGNGPVGLFSFGLFIKPLGAEFGWDRGSISAGQTAASFFVAVGSPVTGWMIDRWGIKRVMIPVITLYAISLAALSLTWASLTGFVVLYAISGIAGAGQAPLPYAKAISAWFDRKRGLALGIAMGGVGLGVMVVPQIIRWVIDTEGWRAGYLALGAITFLLGVPAMALFVREPVAGSTRPEQPAGVLPGLSLREAVSGGPPFWIILTVVFLIATVVNGTFAHLVPLLTDRGFSSTAAVSLLGFVGFATMGGRLISGFLADRFFAPYLAAVIFLLPPVGLLLLGTGAGGVVPLLAVLFLGFASGCEVDMIGFLTSRYFGLRYFGQIYGYMFAMFAAGTGFGPLVMGMCFTVFHSYTVALGVLAAMSLLGSALITRLGPYAYPPGSMEAVVAAEPAPAGAAT